MNGLNTSQMHLNAPGYEDFTFELSTLITGFPPPFIYIHDSEALRVTSGVLDSLLHHLSDPSSSESGSSSKICCAHADAISCFSQRLLFESLIHSLVAFEPSWDDGCGNWGSEGDSRWNENMDSFLHGLRAAHAHLCKKFATSAVRIVVVLEHAERLKENMLELMVPLTRLQELSQLDLSVILVSGVEWDAIKPPLGASPDPYFIDIAPFTKESITKMMTLRFSALSSTPHMPELYHSSLKVLYSHYATVLCDVCYPFTHDPQELQYIAAARWPGFVKPVLDEHRQKSAAFGTDDADIEPPSEDVRLRLTRLFSASLKTAVEALYPRLTNAVDWARANEPELNLLSKSPLEARVTTIAPGGQVSVNALLSRLPRMSKFLLVASFLASTNPAKSDLRMFGRGLDERKRKRRAPNRNAGKPKGGVTKVPQRLLGPSPFPLDRLIAILGALLEENDVESRLPAPEYSIPGEYTDMEISRVGIYAAILEITSTRLMHRTTKADQLDGPPMFKCAISYDTALALSKELKVPLPDLLWEPL